MSIISHAVRDHQGLVGEINLAPGVASTDAVNVSQIGAVKTLIASTAGVGGPLVLLRANSGNYYTNTGATAEAYFTLPTTTANLGVNYNFIVTDADGLRIVAVGADVIQLDTDTSAAAGFYESTSVGTCISIIAAATGLWVINTQIGTGAVT